MVVQTFQADLVQSEAGQRVLHDGVLDVLGAEITAKLGVLCDVDAAIVDENAALRILKALGESFYDGLLFGKDRFARYVWVSPPEMKNVSVQRDKDTQKETYSCGVLGWIYTQNGLPAVFEQMNTTRNEHGCQG
jgi:hypothetical protein